MMSDKSLMRLSLIVVIIGIIGLFITTALIEPENISVSGIDDRYVGKSVIVSANVTAISEKDGNVFITLSDSTGSVRAVMFERAARRFVMPEAGDTVTVTGKIFMYKGELEIVVDKIG